MHKIIFYRNKCIGCDVCYEKQPESWRMSRKDGKATLVGAIRKKDVFILQINDISEQTKTVAKECPVKIIKIL
jgi:ferredoxin